MKLSEIFKQKKIDGKTAYSFEVFPPKKGGPIETIYHTLDNLSSLRPDYISVTYGAGGNSNNHLTTEISSYIKNKLNIESMAHLTCINSSVQTIEEHLSDFEKHNIDNVLTLRGDVNPLLPPYKDFQYAKDLIKFVREKSGNMFGISAACYPEGHPLSENLSEDVMYLKEKVMAGAETLVTQLLFDNDRFYRFMDMAKSVGINVPVSVGIMPVTNKKQIERMVTMCAVSLPPKFVKIMSRYENNHEALLDAGIAYAIDQIVDLIANGVDGIHLYTMNRPFVAEKITASIRSLL